MFTFLNALDPWTSASIISFVVFVLTVKAAEDHPWMASFAVSSLVLMITSKAIQEQKRADSTTQKATNERKWALSEISRWKSLACAEALRADSEMKRANVEMSRADEAKRELLKFQSLRKKTS